MSFLQEQIRNRRENDRHAYSRSLYELGSVVMGGKGAYAALQDDEQKAQTAFSEIFRYYRITPAKVDDTAVDMEERLGRMLRPSGFMRRPVTLSGKWYKEAVGALLGVTEAGDPVALIPGAVSGYTYFDYKQGKRVRVTRRNRDEIQPDAICFYRPFPQRKLGMRDLGAFLARTLSTTDVVMLLLVTLAATLLGMVTPFASRVLFASVIPSGSEGLLVPLLVLLVGVAVSGTLIPVTKTLVQDRLHTKLNLSVEAASMMRVMSLPASFFKPYSAGELSSYVSSISTLCQMLSDAVLSTGLSSLFSLLYIGQIWAFAPTLALPAAVIVALQLAVMVLTTVAQTKVYKRVLQREAQTHGLVYALFSGVQKLKLAGAEKRAFAKWADSYHETAELRYDPPFWVKCSGAVSEGVTLLGVIAFYFIAAKNGVAMADFIAFSAAFWMLSAAITSLGSVTMTAAEIRPVLKMAKPLLDTAPENAGDKPQVTHITGNIELNNVSFRYTPDTPLIVDDVSFRIRAGQYVAIVGATGCGKSTLLRLMLGFETPERGAIYYDRSDLAHVDAGSLRRHIGVVMQNGKLFQGDIFSNIVVTAPTSTLADAWAAAEIAGIADDIHDMPMGMHTILSEGGGGVSGGQRQRLLIARAVCARPRVLMLDEATSALDNVTQKHVSEALDKLRCTRVVIAHRLSTIRQCDRILLLKDGRIAEDGTYDELLAKGGAFAELVKRQQIEPDQK